MPYTGVRSLIALRGSFFPGEGTNAVVGEEIFVKMQPLFRRLGSFICWQKDEGKLLIAGVPRRDEAGGISNVQPWHFWGTLRL